MHEPLKYLPTQSKTRQAAPEPAEHEPTLEDIREHEDLATLRWIITLAAVCTAWYFRGV